MNIHNQGEYNNTYIVTITVLSLIIEAIRYDT
jgi:hypothetical protein